MKNITLLVFLILMIGKLFGQTSFEYDSIKTRVNYPFSVEIDMNHLSRSNDYNFKYLINKKYEFVDSSRYVSFDENKIYLVKYVYTEKPEKGFDYYERTAIDTTTYFVNDNELQEIYNLSFKLFNINNPLTLLKKRQNNADYDGAYVKVSLTLENYPVYYSVVLDFLEKTEFQNRYFDLIEYLEKIKKHPTTHGIVNKRVKQ